MSQPSARQRRRRPDEIDGSEHGTRQSYVLESAERLLDILLFVGSHGGEHGVSELSRRLGLSFSRTYRLVATLEAKGFLERSRGTKRYHIGPRAFEIGMRYLADRPLVARARPYLERLVAESQETGFVAIRHGTEVVFIDRVDSPQVVRFQTAIGSRAPWNCVAAGRALVSAEPTDVMEALLAGALAPCLRPAASDPHHLLAELRLARARGYATNFGDWHHDVAAVAAPVLDPAGRPAAALVLGAPLARLSAERADHLGVRLAQLAREIHVESGGW